MIKTEGYRKEWKAMKGNLIVIHGGGPTAVIKASLAGAIRQAKKEPNVDRILAAIGGTGGLMRGQVPTSPRRSSRCWNARPAAPSAHPATRWRNRNTACWRKNAWSWAQNMC